MPAQVMVTSPSVTSPHPLWQELCVFHESAADDMKLFGERNLVGRMKVSSCRRLLYFVWGGFNFNSNSPLSLHEASLKISGNLYQTCQSGVRKGSAKKWSKLSFAT